MKSKKHKVTDRWYVVQVLKDGKWEDEYDNDFSRREERTEFCMVNLWGKKARIIERIASYRVVAVKDFPK